MIRAITFDFGQTLAELDPDFLAQRVRELGGDADSDRLQAALPVAWQAYNSAIRAGVSGHPWKLLMRALLEQGCARAKSLDTIVDALWLAQPERNLWRRPIPGMIEVARGLRARGLRVGIISNSEGRVAELLTELGWRGDFEVVADSGKLGIEKPALGIFQWTLEQLGVDAAQTIHIGDSYQADVLGAHRAGMHAVLFRGRTFMTEQDARDIALLDRVHVCDDATELERALQTL